VRGFPEIIRRTVLKNLVLSVILAGTLIILAAGMAIAAPNIYGTSGLFEVPDDIIYPVGSLTPAYHFVSTDGNDDFNFFTVGAGILPNLSVSGGVVDAHDSEAIINAKYRLSPESADRPSITLGVVDATGELNADDDPGLYILFGKNLTAAAEDVSGGISKPLRGYLGLGTGTLKGVFFGLDWTLTPRLSGIVEYVSEGLEGDAHFNGGVRVAVTNELRVDLGLIDFDDFTAGVSYNAIRF
jgi:hypothetical protein